MVNKIISLYRGGKQLILLEIAYIALAVAAFFAAGVVALFNQSLGVGILIVPLVALISGAMNVVIWSLVRSFVEALAKIKGYSETKDNTKTTVKTTKKSSKKK